MNKNTQKEIKMSRVSFQAKGKDEPAQKQSSNTSAASVKPAPQLQPVNGGVKAAERTEPAISLKGLLAAKRLTKELKIRASRPRLRIHQRKPIAIINDQVPAGSATPKEKFPCGEAKQLIAEYLHSKLASVKYDPVACSSLATKLCDEIKQMVKRATPARYKLICNVTIGSSDMEDIVVTSQCLWDPHADNFASCSYANKTMFCVVSVYAVYVE